MPTTAPTRQYPMKIQWTAEATKVTLLVSLQPRTTPTASRITGTAPGVSLGAYRIFGCNGSGGNDVLIAAFNKAY
ncbi:hypothetical protein E4U56_005621 [Claviceps arundinis]|uniref:Uncharacterized protein n=1 Tax=Claviceps arundinis TaxID=1623583 RepID=A0A9P7MMK9_9HYPO|nr:hypothetical protein E4U56_005621 [Claviceps arundinis]